MSAPLVVGNCSGFYGDRLSAARELVSGGHLDVLTGDWLAELTMLILARQRLKHGPGSGYARTFLTEMEQVLGECVHRGIKVVSNAGGLDPAGCAEQLRELAVRLGVPVTVAYVEGDDLLPRMDELAAAGEQLANLDTGELFDTIGMPALTANAYVGAFGIKAALDAGADVVVTGRVVDAALVVGPAAWRFGWTPDDLDPLAGAVVAGHVLECGAQATGGNYAMFEQVPGLEHVGFPIAEVSADGSSVITKHPGTGGLVSVGTVTAQLLYEVAGPAYLGPDVTARFDSIRLEQEAPDRVHIFGVVGEPPPDRLKVALNYLAGFRNQLSFVLTGLDVDAKAKLVERQLFGADGTGRDSLGSVTVQLLRHRAQPFEAAPGVPAEPEDLWQAQAEMRVTVRDRDPNRVGKAFTAPAVEIALASVPGLFGTAPPAEPAPYGVFWPTSVAASFVTQRVVALPAQGGDPVEVGLVSAPQRRWHRAEGEGDESPSPTGAGAAAPDPGATVRVPLGWLVGARSGDKGGNANVGLWVRDDSPDPPAGYAWLEGFLTEQRFRELVPEAAGLGVDVFAFPNLRAVNVVVHGMLGRGVAENTSLDPQAKGLGEYLRARHADVPARLLPDGLAATATRASS